jgi:hypothetical protein
MKTRICHHGKGLYLALYVTLIIRIRISEVTVMTLDVSPAPCVLKPLSMNIDMIIKQTSEVREK